MMNNGSNECTGFIQEGYLLGREDGQKVTEDFSLASMLMMLFYVHAGPFLKIETVADFKKAVRDFNDSIQEMELPEPEVKPDEV